MLTKEAIQNMSEADLRAQILIPLVKAMGYQDVFEYHGGIGEQGKDIVAWKFNDIGIRKNYALVVKAQAVNGRAQVSKGSAGEVQMQITQCFGDPYLDTKTGQRQDIDQCWVVSNREITKEAVQSINSAISATKLDRLTTFIDGDKLWDLVQEHLPTLAVMQTLHNAGKLPDSIDDHYSLIATVANGVVGINIREKFPGAAQEKPLMFSPKFVFPDTDEGRAKKDELEKAYNTGSPAEIPAEFVESIEVPDFLKALGFGLGTISIEPVTDTKIIFIGVQIQNNDGREISLDNIPFRITQVGQKEMTLESIECPVPIYLKIVFRLEDKIATLNLRIKDMPMNVTQLQTALKIKDCLSNSATIQCFNMETRLPLFTMPQSPKTYMLPDKELLNFIEDLVNIQMRLKRPITMPARELTDEELGIIGRLRQILHTGRLDASWNHFSITVPRKGLPDIFSTFGENKMSMAGFDREETIKLFDMELPLGMVRHRFNQVRLENEPKVLEEYRSSLDDDELIEVAFAPGENTSVTLEYLGWSSNSEVNNN